VTRAIVLTKEIEQKITRQEKLKSRKINIYHELKRLILKFNEKKNKSKKTLIGF